MPTATVPNIGDDFIVRELNGYRLHQNRPMECRTYGPTPSGHYGYGCKCGTCDGSTTTYRGTVVDVIYWADNSIDVIVHCEDGERRTTALRSPSGDLC